MRPRTVLALVAAKAVSTGAVATVNRALRLDDLPPTLPGRTHDWPWRHNRVRYTTLGEGPPLVLVHGIHAAASSFEMRQVFEPLSRHYTVYAPDLLGFGKSERPSLAYTGALYASLLDDFLREVVGEPARVVASSLSAAYAVECAVRRPDAVERLVLICPTGEAGLTGPGPASDAIYWLFRLPFSGEALFNLLVARMSLRSFLERRVFADSAKVTDALVDQQYATAHQPNARVAPAAFIGRRLNLPLPPRIGRLTQPTLLVWGGAARLTPPTEAAVLRAAYPAAELAVIDGTGELPHDEQADRFLARVEPFLAGARAAESIR